jgi:ABC-2 type transport system permease protein
MMMSSLTDSQIISFFVTACVLAFFQFLGGMFEQVHGWFGDAIAFVSFEARYNGFARGLIDTKAVVYFLSIAIVCLLVSFRSLESRKWS